MQIQRNIFSQNTIWQIYSKWWKLCLNFSKTVLFFSQKQINFFFHVVPTPSLISLKYVAPNLTSPINVTRGNVFTGNCTFEEMVHWVMVHGKRDTGDLSAGKRYYGESYDSQKFARADTDNNKNNGSQIL
jgi:hypothetical protein